jgi:sugar/nucleoside kinase (ribokinase family)
LSPRERTSTFDLLVVGEINADLLLYGDVTPEFGQAEKLVKDAVLTLSGSSAIVAHRAAKLGLCVAFAGKVGSDTFGVAMVRMLAEAGIDVSGVVTDPKLKTGLTVHLVRGEDRAMLTCAGTIAAMHPEEVDGALLESTRHLHIGSYFLQRGLQHGRPAFLARAREAGATTSVDPGWDPHEEWDSGLRAALEETDFFLPNEQEVLKMTGTRSLADALKELSGITTVVVKRGASGAMVSGEGRELACAPPAVAPVDTTGAGDSFDAGFIYGLLQVHGLEQALRFGCACGALSTTGEGGIEAQPDLDLLLETCEPTYKGERR